MAEFTIDSDAFAAWADILQESVAHTTQTKSNVAEIQETMRALTDQFSTIKFNKDFLTELADIQTAFKNVSSQLTIFTSGLKDLKIGSSLKTELDGIKAKLKEIEDRPKGSKKQDENDKKQKDALTAQLKAVAQWTTGLFGIQFSLVGILSLFLKIYNETNRIEGYSKRISAQMGGNFNANLQAARNTMAQMQNQFALSYDEAGKHLNTLAQTGMEMDVLKKSAIELYAIQAQGGLSIQEQATGVNRLMTELNLTGDAARNYNTLLHTTGKTIEGLSLSQVAEDWSQITDSIKGYNTDLLGTVSLYNSLTRKDVAEQLGLGDMPQEFRRDLAKTAAGFSKDMEYGWKAFLGQGDTLAAKILEFEGKGPGEQLARAVTAAQKIATQSSQPIEYTMLKMRKVFAAMGMDEKTIAKSMSDAVVGGKFNVDEFKKIMDKARKKGEEELKASEKSRDALINLGSTIERSLVSLEKKLEQWANNTLRPYVEDIVRALNNLANTLKPMLSFFGKESPEKVEAKRMAAMQEIPEYKTISGRMQEKAAVGQQLTNPEVRKALLSAPAYAKIKEELQAQVSPLGFSETDVANAALGLLSGMMPGMTTAQQNSAKTLADINRIKAWIKNQEAAFNQQAGAAVRSIGTSAEFNTVTVGAQSKLYHDWGIGSHPVDASGRRIHPGE